MKGFKEIGCVDKKGMGEFFAYGTLQDTDGKLQI